MGRKVLGCNKSTRRETASLKSRCCMRSLSEPSLRDPPQRTGSICVEPEWWETAGRSCWVEVKVPRGVPRMKLSLRWLILLIVTINLLHLASIAAATAWWLQTFNCTIFSSVSLLRIECEATGTSGSSSSSITSSGWTRKWLLGYKNLFTARTSHFTYFH